MQPHDTVGLLQFVGTRIRMRILIWSDCFRSVINMDFSLFVVVILSEKASLSALERVGTLRHKPSVQKPEYNSVCHGNCEHLLKFFSSSLYTSSCNLTCTNGFSNGGSSDMI